MIVVKIPHYFTFLDNNLSIKKIGYYYCNNSKRKQLLKSRLKWTEEERK